MHSVLPPGFIVLVLEAPYPSSPSSSSSSSITIHDIESHGGLDEISIVVGSEKGRRRRRNKRKEEGKQRRKEKGNIWKNE